MIGKIKLTTDHWPLITILMPTYEYKCDACGHTFEKFQPITSGPIRKCPGCGKLKVRRLLSTGGGLIFKGSGFYITDYRSEGYKSAAKADNGSPAGSSNGKPSSESAPSAPAKPTPAEPTPAKSSPAKAETAPPKK